jgi:hypothetical protein
MAFEWEVESLRVSLFSNEPTQVTDEDWRAVTSQSEYNRQAIPGGYIFSGTFANSQLNFSGIHNRVDFIQSPTLSSQPGPDITLPVIGPWEASREKFLSFTSAWMNTANFPIVRIAFGAVLRCRTKSRVASYETLKALLSSVSVDPEKMRELSFRINWPTKSKIIDGLVINRITSWSAIELLFASFQLDTTLSSATTPLGLHAVRLEIDHSTDQTRSEPFVREQVLSLYKELVSVASENAAKGECP